MYNCIQDLQPEILPTYQQPYNYICFFSNYYYVFFLFFSLFFFLYPRFPQSFIGMVAWQETITTTNADDTLRQLCNYTRIMLNTPKETLITGFVLYYLGNGTSLLNEHFNTIVTSLVIYIYNYFLFFLSLSNITLCRNIVVLSGGNEISTEATRRKIIASVGEIILTEKELIQSIVRYW